MNLLNFKPKHRYKLGAEEFESNIGAVIMTYTILGIITSIV